MSELLNAKWFAKWIELLNATYSRAARLRLQYAVTSTNVATLNCVSIQKNSRSVFGYRTVYFTAEHIPIDFKFQTSFVSDFRESARLI